MTQSIITVRYGVIGSNKAITVTDIVAIEYSVALQIPNITQITFKVCVSHNNHLSIIGKNFFNIAQAFLCWLYSK